MTRRVLSVAVMAALLAMAMLVGPAAAQPDEVPDELLEGLPDEVLAEIPDEIPEGMELDEFIETYIPEVLPEVIEPEPEPQPQPEPEVEVLGVVQERLPVTGGDLLGLAFIGLVLAALGYFALRRGRASLDQG